MDFIILKVNGQDLSSASHNQILNVFRSASEPILVEVARNSNLPSSSSSSSRTNIAKPSTITMTDLSLNAPHNGYHDSVVISPYATSVITPPTQYAHDMARSNHSSMNDANIGLSTSQSMFYGHSLPANGNDTNGSDPVKSNGILEEDEEEDHDEEDEEDQVDIIKEHVILRKLHPREIFGLTLSYSALAANDNSESEVYISAIESDSVASKQPSIRIGDQILQINNIDVHSKAQVVSLFRSCGLEVQMLLGRPNVTPRKNAPINGKISSFNCDLAPVEEAEYSSVYDDVEPCKDEKEQQSQLDKDSGIGRGTDERDTKTGEESSECDSVQTSSQRQSSQCSSLDSRCQGRVDTHHISLLMQHLAIEYQQLQRLLQTPGDGAGPRLQALPPPSLGQTPPSRVVPRMGTKLEPPQMKTVATMAPANTATTSASAYTSSMDSIRSSPLTMELGHNIHCSSLLSLKIDNLANTRLATNLDDNSLLATKLSIQAGADHQGALTCSAPDILDPRMVLSSTVITDLSSQSSHDLECHYYDVYDPATTTTNGSTTTRYDHEALTQSLHQGSYLDHDYVNASLIRSSHSGSKMEWVVKKRPDGTRYITRRPIRDKMPRDRTKRVCEEKTAVPTTTEEEDSSMDARMGRVYSCKSEKKRHPDRTKEKRHKKRDIGLTLHPDSPAMSRTESHSLNRVTLRDLIVVDHSRMDQQRHYDRPSFAVGSTMF